MLLEQPCQVDVHKGAAEGESGAGRDLDAPLWQVERGWLHAGPHSGALAPEVLDELLRTPPFGVRRIQLAPVGY
jgi:hypothetical protein